MSSEPMSSDVTDDGRKIDQESIRGDRGNCGDTAADAGGPAATEPIDRYDPVVDEFGVVQSIGSISVGDLVYLATDEFEAGPTGAALARMAHDYPDQAEGQLLTLRYIAASRARDEVAMADIAYLVGEQKLVGGLLELVTAAWLELGYDPDQILASLTHYALSDICGSVADG